jgi:hypothetical protein
MIILLTNTLQGINLFKHLTLSYNKVYQKIKRRKQLLINWKVIPLANLAAMIFHLQLLYNLANEVK